MGWPVFKTQRNGDRHLTRADWTIAGVVTVLLPCLTGLLFVYVMGLLFPDDAYSPPHALFTSIIAAQALAPVVTLFVIVPALYMAAAALRIGWGGWGIAIAMPAVVIPLTMAAHGYLTLGYLPQSYLIPILIVTSSGIFHAAILWTTLRIRQPRAVAPR